LAVLVGLVVTGTGSAVGQSPGVARRSTPAGTVPAGFRLPPAAAGVYKCVKMRRPNEAAWKGIPWMVDLTEAIQQAKAENRPILLFVSGGPPLEHC